MSNWQSFSGYCRFYKWEELRMQLEKSLHEIISSKKFKQINTIAATGQISKKKCNESLITAGINY